MSRARAARRPLLGEFITLARHRFSGVAPRKVRYVVDLIRGLTVAEAQERLALVHRPSAVPMVSNALKSAAANAVENESKTEDESQALLIGEIMVDSGPMLKRFRPRAYGRAATIRKRMSHLTVKLYEQA